MKYYFNLNYEIEPGVFIFRFAIQHEDIVYTCDYYPIKELFTRNHCSDNEIIIINNRKSFNKDKFNIDYMISNGDKRYFMRDIATLFIKHKQFAPNFRKFLQENIYYLDGNEYMKPVYDELKKMLDVFNKMKKFKRFTLYCYDVQIHALLGEIEINDEVYFIIQNYKDNAEMIKADNCKLVGWSLWNTISI